MIAVLSDIVRWVVERDRRWQTETGTPVTVLEKTDDPGDLAHLLTVPPPGLLRMSARVRNDILEHLRRALPNEGVGLLAVGEPRDATRRMDVVQYFPGTNADASASRFTMEPSEVIAALREIDDRGWRLGAIVHSHPHGPASPSPTDLREARHPEALMLIVSLASAEPEIGAWWIGSRRNQPSPQWVPIEVV